MEFWVHLEAPSDAKWGVDRMAGNSWPEAAGCAKSCVLCFIHIRTVTLSSGR